MSHLFRNNPADPGELPRAVLAALPPWANYAPYGGEVAALLQGGTFTIAAKNVAPAKDALTQLPTTVTADVFDSDWFELDLAGALCAWGWGARTLPRGDVLVGGTYAEAVAPSQFAALAAINPHRATHSGPWVFSGPRLHEPAFAVTFTDDGLELSTDVDLEIDYRVH